MEYDAVSIKLQIPMQLWHTGLGNRICQAIANCQPGKGEDRRLLSCRVCRKAASKSQRTVAWV